MNKHFIVACIPAYNEEKTIASVIVKAMKHVDKVMVCDDGSTDLTGEIPRRLETSTLKSSESSRKDEFKDRNLKSLEKTF